METNERARELHARLLSARCQLRRAERELALLLAEIADDAHFRALGYVSLAEYAEATLELSPRQTRDLLRLGRRLPGLPVLDQALADGTIDWTKARELARVVTAETEAGWVARAQTQTARVIEREVAAALEGDKARDGEPEPGPCRTRLVFDVDSADAQLIRDGLARMRAEAALNKEEVEDGALLAAIVRRGLAAEAEADAPTAEVWRAVVDLCPGCRQTIVGDAAVSEAVAGEIACDAEVVNMLPGATQGHITRTIPPSTRRLVLHRHGNQCAVPGCRNRLWLHIHHLKSRACGGGHEPDNLVPCCPAHHRAIHEGLVGLSRDARGGIVVHRRGMPHVGRPAASSRPGAAGATGATGGTVAG